MPQQDPTPNNDPTSATGTLDPSTLSPEQKTLFDKLVADALKPIKANLDAAFSARDEAKRQLDEKERKEREAEAARLEAEGKVKEAADIRVAEERTAREQAERRVTELTRDTEIRAALASVDFRNKNAQDMAYQAILRDVVKNDAGNWVSKDGSSIQAAVTKFAAHEDNAFLLKPRQSSGGGGSAPAGGPTGGETSLFKMSQDQVLEMARQGKLPPRRRR